MEDIWDELETSGTASGNMDDFEDNVSQDIFYSS